MCKGAPCLTSVESLRATVRMEMKVAGPFGNPRNKKTRYIPPQTIIQIASGVTSFGTIANTGGYEKVQSDGHNLSNLGSGDCGGPLILERRKGWATTKIQPSGSLKGSQIAVHPTTGIISAPASPDRTTMWGQGGTAIARSLPAQPYFDGADTVAQSIGFGAIPRMVGSALWRERTLQFKHLGSEYLNVQFGWIPFVNDIMDCMHAVKNSRSFLNDLEAGSGKKTRVGYAFPQSSNGDTALKGMVVYSKDGTLSSQCTQGTSNHYVHTQTSDVWFKGCFTYHLPVPRKNMSFVEKSADYADHVLGIGASSMTPQILWDACPWTWAVDWAVNVGDVAKNIGAIGKDGLTLQYGYIMSHRQNKTIWQAGGNPTVSGLTFTINNEWKVRWPASPYGFGLTYDGLSLKQKSILAAIGISHF